MNIAIYTNILTPYRTYFFNTMLEECKNQGINFHVIVMADTEPGRTWKYEDFKAEYTILLNHKTFSKGETYIHINNNIKKVLKELKIDILICAGSYLCPGIWTALRLRKRLGYKVYFWSESHLNESRNYGGLKIHIRDFLRKAVYRRFDGFWFAGKMSQEFIEAYCNSTASFMFMPNLVEEDKYKKAGEFPKEIKKQIRMKYDVTEERVVFICPARLSPVKGIDKFVSILSQAKYRARATVLVAGDGEQKELISKMVKNAQIDVRLLGFKDQKEIVELYGIADYFVLPSISDANPLTCIEALWARLPLYISENCGNYPEVIHQGINGYSFRYNNIEDAVEKLDKMISADECWKRQAKQESFDIAEKNYNSKNVVKRIIKEMENALSSK